MELGKERRKRDKEENEERRRHLLSSGKKAVLINGKGKQERERSSGPRDYREEEEK